MFKKRLMSAYNSLYTWIYDSSLLTKILILIVSTCLMTGTLYFYFTAQSQIALITSLPVTPPVTPPPASDINIVTKYVSLQLERVDLQINSAITRSIISAPPDFQSYSEIKSDNPNIAFLDTSWYENGQQIRLVIDIQNADAKVGSNYVRKWWISRIVSHDPYNGWIDWSSESPELYNPHSAGETLYLPNTTLTNTQGGSNFYLHLTNLRIQAFGSESDCHYLQIQCIQAPCNPVWTCGPNPSSSPNFSPSPYPSASSVATCDRHEPLVAISPNNQSGIPGQTLTYNVSITNTDSQPCGSSNFGFGTMASSPFTADPSVLSNYIPAGATFKTTFTATSPSTNPWNEERTVPLSFSATNFSSQLNTSSTTAYTLLIPTPQTYDLFFKLAGVKDDSASGAKITVKFYLQDGTVRALSAPIDLVHSYSDIYKSTFTIANPLPAGTKFRLKVKGEKHISIEFCRASGQTSPCADNEYMTIPANSQSVQTLFLAGIPLPPGDLAPQDGVANLNDLLKLKTLMSNSQSTLTSPQLLVGDVNYDDHINIYDVFLLLKTLESRYDD